jgi:probable HAF family extracellular repeat protein
MRAILWRRGRTIDIGTLGGSSALAFDVNPGGVVVGLSSTSEDLAHAFRWRAGKMTDLGTLGGPTSTANGINPAGEIVGHADALDDHYHAVVWQGNEILDLGTPGTTSVAWDISANGQVVGSTRARPGFDDPGPNVPVLWVIR